ncbi:hypothetical protein PIB30_103401 [Stylosanthes scabra]|uniref:Uncharacterized protein n=1 Tax=Stylosanthes scabra TaxID=79078 RepID=A0ABU6XX63_9FABA|nr:hypothetical protein [Stylosanthes scabra]
MARSGSRSERGRRSYGELTRSGIIANPTDPELALDNHRSYFPGGPFFPAPIADTTNISEIRGIELGTRKSLPQLYGNNVIALITKIDGGGDSDDHMQRHQLPENEWQRLKVTCSDQTSSKNLKEGRWVRMYSHRRRFSNGNGNLRRPETSLVSSGDKNCDGNALLNRRRRESSRTRAELRRRRRVLGGGVAAAINKNSNNALSLSMHFSPLLSNLSTTTTTGGRSSVNGDGEVTARNGGCGEGRW